MQVQSRCLATWQHILEVRLETCVGVGSSKKLDPTLNTSSVMLFLIYIFIKQSRYDFDDNLSYFYGVLTFKSWDSPPCWDLLT